MKRIIAILSVIFTVFFVGCSNMMGHSGGSSSSKHVMPKFANYTASFKSSMLKSGAKKEVVGGKVGANIVLSNPGSYDGYVVTNDFSAEHCVLFDQSPSSETLSELSTPPFNGFTMANYSDGDKWTTTFFNRTVTNTASISSDGNIITFTGKCNDGGGSYILVINSEARSFTLETYLIFDAALYNSIDPSKYPSDKMFFDLSRITLYVYQSGNFDSTGSYTTGSGYSAYICVPYVSTLSGQITTPYTGIIGGNDVATNNYGMYEVDSYTSDEVEEYFNYYKMVLQGSSSANDIFFTFKSGPNFYIMRDDLSVNTDANGNGGGGYAICTANDVPMQANPAIFGTWPNYTNFVYDNTALYQFMQGYHTKYILGNPRSIWYEVYDDTRNSYCSGGMPDAHWCIYQSNGGNFGFVRSQSNNGASSNEAQIETIWNAYTLPSDLVTPVSINTEPASMFY